MFPCPQLLEDLFRSTRDSFSGEENHVTFLGVAVGTSTYAATNDLEVRITEEHLPLIAERPWTWRFQIATARTPGTPSTPPIGGVCLVEELALRS